jgi:hypothetical protein
MPEGHRLWVAFFRFTLFAMMHQKRRFVARFPTCNRWWMSTGAPSVKKAGLSSQLSSGVAVPVRLITLRIPFSGVGWVKVARGEIITEPPPPGTGQATMLSCYRFQTHLFRGHEEYTAPDDDSTVTRKREEINIVNIKLVHNSPN